MNFFLIKFLLTIKNASIQRKEYVCIRYTKYILKIVDCLYRQGLIQSYKVSSKNSIKIILRYFFNKPIFKNLKIISTPSRNRYLKLKKITTISTKKNVMLFSTHLGILTLIECKKFKVGGKALFIC